MIPDWDWPIEFSYAGVDVIIAGPSHALTYLETDWPFPRDDSYFLARQRIAAHIGDASFSADAYLIFRAAIAGAGVVLLGA